MQTVARAIRRSGTIGEPLPEVYRSLTKADVKFRRGGTSLVAGWPGSFKSTLALNLLVNWAQQDLVAFYISADSDEYTVSKRCASIITSNPMEKVEESLRAGGYSEQLKMLRNVHWEFRPLNIEQIDERLVAIQKMHGKMPDLIVVDNLMNMVPNPTDYSAQMTITRDLDTLARSAGSHVMILHHTHENQQSKNTRVEPQAIWDIHGKINQFPRLVLTLAAEPVPEREAALLMVACVKNTNGYADRTGREYTEFKINTPCARIEEPRGS
jgi:KaiC/GvpD/RAD55 family RecA-like ATPase